MLIKEFLSDGKRLIDRALNSFLPRGGKLARAMRYSVFAGGKRFRPILCLATARALGCAEKKIIPFACAVELIHTFTLIHDDLPAMDNSDLRRGKPTCHKVFGEALSILAGDALNTLAFRITAAQPAASGELARALLEVVEGQVRDIDSAGKRITLAQLKAIHNLKTAALLRACVRGTALIAGATTAQINALTACADHLGLAFQIADDILDLTSTRKRLGKPVKSDTEKGFPYLVGLEKARAMARRERDGALAALKIFGPRADHLRRITEYVVSREK